MRPSIFEVLGTLLTQSTYCTLADAMQVIAAEARLRFLTTGGTLWFSDQTIASLACPAVNLAFSAVLPEWRQAAEAMLRGALRLEVERECVPAPSDGPTVRADGSCWAALESERLWHQLPSTHAGPCIPGGR